MMPDFRPLLRIDEALAQLEWPVLTSLQSICLEEADVLVLCAGFEARAVTAVRTIIAQATGRFSAVVIEYEPKYNDNRGPEITGMCRSGNVESVWFIYDRRAPGGLGDGIALRVANASRVYIDISAMSRMLAVQLIVALSQRERGLAGVHVLYTEASSYPPAEGEVRTDAVQGGTASSYISSGVWELAAVPELSAPTSSATALRLVAFPSFNPAQLELLLQELQPTFVDLVSGIPPRAENSWRPEAIRRSNERTVRSLRNVTYHLASTLDYRETVRLLLQLYDDRSAFDRIVVSPSGSKMQSVGIAVVRSFLTDLQIVYPTPQTFLEPRRHTVGSRGTCALDLSAFAAVRHGG